MATVATALAKVQAVIAELRAAAQPTARWASVAGDLGYVDPAVPLIYRQDIDISDMLVMQGDIPGPDRYHRYQRRMLITGNGAYGWTSENIVAGGIGDPLDYARNALMVYPPDLVTGVPGAGVVIGILTRTSAGTEKSGMLNTVLPPDLRDGNHPGHFVPLNDDGTPIASALTESSPMRPITIDRFGQAKDDPFYVSALSDWEWHDDAVIARHFYSIKRVAEDWAQARPQARDARQWPVVARADWAKLYTRNLIIPQGQGIDYQPCRDLQGRVTTAGISPYFTQEFAIPQPRRTIMPGEFGVARFSHVIDIDPARNNDELVFTPWTWLRAHSTGRVRILLGFYHAEPVLYTDVETLNATKGGAKPHPALRSRGIWPKVNGAELPWYSKAPRLSWGGGFVKSSTAQGTGAPVQDATMYAPEQPHDGQYDDRWDGHFPADPVTGKIPIVIGYCLNGMGGRILRVLFSGRDHTIEPIVEIAAVVPGAIEFNPVTGIDLKSDEIDWQDLHDGTYLVTMRSKHCVARFQMMGIGQTDTFLGYITQPTAGVTVTGNVVEHQYICTSHTVAGLRNLDFPAAPECLDTLDDPTWPWVVISSQAAGLAWEWNKNTGELRRAFQFRDGTQSQTLVAQVKYGDGTVCEKGAVALNTFDNQSSGGLFYLPVPGPLADGRTYSCSKWVAGPDTVTGAGQAIGVGPQLNSIYPLVTNPKQFRITRGGTEAMLRQWRGPMPGDDPMPDQARGKLGLQEYYNMGGHVEWGPFGWSASSKALPTTGNIPYWLRYFAGHYELGAVT